MARDKDLEVRRLGGSALLAAENWLASQSLQDETSRGAMIAISLKTEPIFLASNLQDELLRICWEISASPERERRLALMRRAEVVITKMLQNAVQNVGDRPFIVEKLKGLKDAVEVLAEKPLESNGNDLCPACGDALQIRHDMPKYCRRCMYPLYVYRDHLGSEEGFGTCYI